MSGISFEQGSGRLISRPGRGRRGRAWRAAAVVQASASVKPSAREWFPALRERLLASRPVLESVEVNDFRTGRTYLKETFGAPTFRNVIDEKGSHV